MTEYLSTAPRAASIAEGASPPADVGAEWEPDLTFVIVGSVGVLVVGYLLLSDGSGSSSGAVDDDQEESGDGFEHAGGLMD